MDATTWIEDTGEPRAQKCACVVRRRAGGKGLQPQYLACGLSYFLLGYIGTRAEAEEIKQQLGEFMQETLKLELSKTKTLITHARTEKAKFLGYEIHTVHEDSHLHDKRHKRNVNGRIGLRVPRAVIMEKCQSYMKNGKAI